MPTIAKNNWVSSAGVRLHRRAWVRPQATQARATTAPAPITVSAMPLFTW